MGAHWYTVDGKPCHTQKKKCGGKRSTTLRDARVKNLFPSVTTILGVAEKDALTRWKIDQNLLACLTLPKIDGETLESFKKRVMLDAMVQVEDAKRLGSEIHDSIEQFFKGQKRVKHQKSAEAVYNFVVSYTGLGKGWIAEKTFSCASGYGGMIDLHHESGLWVVDYKTKDFGEHEINKKMAYDENCMQISAYSHGIGFPNAKKMNIFVSRTVPGLITHHEWDTDMYDRFECLLKYWQLVKNYKPE